MTPTEDGGMDLNFMIEELDSADGTLPGIESINDDDLISVSLIKVACYN